MATGPGTGSGQTSLYPYPIYRSSDDSLRIAADSALFTYDLMGRMRTAVNGDAIVRRSYWPNGLLRGDTLQVRTIAEVSAGGGFTQHVYGMELAYDLDGRRVELKHPTALAPRAGSVVKDRTHYAYDPVMGTPRQVTDPLGNPIRFHFDARGDLDTLTTPGVTQSFAYDDDGRRTYHGVTRAGTQVRGETFLYDDAGKLLRSGNPYGNIDSLSVRYTGMGHLLESTNTYLGYQPAGSTQVRFTERELPRGDALANLGVSTRTTYLKQQGQNQYETSNTTSYFAYLPGSGRLWLRATGSSQDTLKYDQAGNTVFTTTIPSASAPSRADLASFYDAEGRLRVVDSRQQDDGLTRTSPVRVTFEEYRYDALGRRVLTRARRTCYNLGGQSGDFRCAHSLARRTVWDGDQELYEIQQPDDDAENDTSATPVLSPYDNNWDPNPMFGRVLYTSGVQIDQPLGIIRMKMRDRVGSATVDWEDFALFPLWNSRGQVERATFVDGSEEKCKLVGVT
ncbi:MAG TPA: hypothetical protein VFQ39_03075, partial [Longimicrobium sp.]|nr:hypothetical protein [Longimicrobium sp.]